MSVAFEGRCRLVSHPVDPDVTPRDAADFYHTINDVPFEFLMQGENHMAVIVDRSRRRVLLKIPNDRGWRFHFGVARNTQYCRDPEAVKRDVADSVRRALNLDESAQSSMSLRPAGLMLFSFRRHAPLKVHVWEWSPDKDQAASLKQGIGVWYDFGDVPYQSLWADDVFWMPTLLREEGSYFEGHFVFDGPPGPTSKLLKHSYNTFPLKE